MLVRLLEILVIIAAIGGGIYLIHHMIAEYRTNRAAAKLEAENRRVIAVSKTMAALKKRNKLDIEITLRLYGDDMGEDLAQRCRDTLIDIALGD